ncbi:MAG: DUF4375 domain-containing protein [Planctomycetales bacterium]|nr:DUF4375 domain-containing protein [Planctomycetales bacterium]
MLDGDQPGYRYWSLVDPIWLPLNESWGDADDADDVAAFTQQFKMVRAEGGHLYAAHWCQSEVCNGGLHQFFTNSTGLLAPEALDAFEVIGLIEWAEILTEAMLFFGSPYPRERTKRQEFLAGQCGWNREEWNPFDALDHRFFEWLHAEPDRWERKADSYADRVSRQ